MCWIWNEIEICNWCAMKGIENMHVWCVVRVLLLLSVLNVLHSTVICMRVLRSSGCLCTFNIILITSVFCVLCLCGTGCAGACIYMCTWRPEDDFSCHSAGFYLFFWNRAALWSEIGKAGPSWPVCPRNRPASASQRWGYEQAHPHFFFFFNMGSGYQTQILVLARQMLYCLSHTPSPACLALSYNSWVAPYKTNIWLDY